MTIIGAVFGAVGTCGQRCTSTRRLIIHEEIYSKVIDALKKAYKQLRIGDPLDVNNHIGPLIDKEAVSQYLNAIDMADKEGANWLIKGASLSGAEYEGGCYVSPSVAEMNDDASVVQTETFAPLLYVMKYSGDVQNAINIQNNVTQGLSSAIMTTNLREKIPFGCWK